MEGISLTSLTGANVVSGRPRASPSWLGWRVGWEIKEKTPEGAAVEVEWQRAPPAPPPGILGNPMVTIIHDVSL